MYLASNSLDTQLPSRYTPTTQKRVLIKSYRKKRLDALRYWHPRKIARLRYDPTAVAKPSVMLMTSTKLRMMCARKMRTIDVCGSQALALRLLPYRHACPSDVGICLHARHEWRDGSALTLSTPDGSVRHGWRALAFGWCSPSHQVSASSDLTELHALRVVSFSLVYRS